MKNHKLFATVAITLLAFSCSAFAQKMKAEDVLLKHLESIGNAETRAAIKSQIAVGDVTLKSIAQKNLVTQGRAVMASSGEKNFFGFSMNAADYPSEKFSYDGNKPKVAYVRVGARSILGNFIDSNSVLLEESLLGGTLSTSWALRSFDEKKAKISFEGTKKIDGREEG